MTSQSTVTLWRPVGAEELELIRQSAPWPRERTSRLRLASPSLSLRASSTDQSARNEFGGELPFGDERFAQSRTALVALERRCAEPWRSAAHRRGVRSCWFSFPGGGLGEVEQVVES